MLIMVYGYMTWQGSKVSSCNMCHVNDSSWIKTLSQCHLCFSINMATESINQDSSSATIIGEALRVRSVIIAICQISLQLYESGHPRWRGGQSTRHVCRWMDRQRQETSTQIDKWADKTVFPWPWVCPTT